MHDGGERTAHCGRVSTSEAGRGDVRRQVPLVLCHHRDVQQQTDDRTGDDTDERPLREGVVKHVSSCSQCQ